MKHLSWWPALGSVVLASAVLAGCGSGGDSSDAGSVRVINATLTHPSLDLLQNASLAVSATKTDTVSDYADVPAGSPTLQFNDAGSSTALLTTSATITGGQHYALVAYESGGVVRTNVLTEDFAAPASGTGQFRIYDAAIDAGALDVYITAPNTDLKTVSSPTTAFSAQTFAQSSALMAYAPGTYQVRVTPTGSNTQVLFDRTVTIVDQQILTIALTPTPGGILLDGSMLSQQGAYTPFRNTTARVRLAAAVSGSVSVAAGAGSIPIDSFTLAPAVGTYAIVPASGALNININGGSIGAPVATLKAGMDYTLLVYGNGASATASLVTDDNHLPTTTTNVKMRLLNGITGTVSGLTLDADFSPVASNVLPSVSSAYGTIPGDTAMELDVTSALSSAPIFSRSGLSVTGPSVYTMFMVGDSSAPQGLLRRDR